MNAIPPAASYRPLAVVTGASSGIGLELARCCAEDGFDLVIAADEPDIEAAASTLRSAHAARVDAVQADLATTEGVDRLVQAVGERPVDALVANAGCGLADAFLDQDLDEARHVIDTNVTGTLLLLHRLARPMRTRGRGRILITGSIAGLMPGSYLAVYHATKAFVDSFAFALADELKDSGVTVTCLMPGATDTRFFERAGLEDTKLGTAKKADPASVARAGYKAMMNGSAGLVPGAKNKFQAAMSHVTPAPLLAAMTRAQARPGSGRHREGGAEAPWLLALGLVAGGLALAALGSQAAAERGRYPRGIAARRRFV